MATPATSSPFFAYKILALHGYNQNANTFRRVLSLSFLPRISHLAECVFIDAPHRTKEALGGGCWWHPSHSEPEAGGSKRWVYDGWEQSLELLRHVDATQGPFDGVLGFSQGACATSALAAQHSQPDSSPAVQFGFAIMVGGFAYRGQGAGPLFRHRPLRMRSLHVYGQRDKIVNPKSSDELASLFDSPAVHSHTGGHAFPQTDASIAVFADFIRAQSSAPSAQA
jgi:pimeloyl-ACP methyl ester carboxylesterase